MGRVDEEKHKEFLDSLDEFNIIDPMLPFEGSFYLSSNINNRCSSYIPNQDIWVLNSKVDKNGDNLYQNLIDRYFYRGINKELFTGNSISIMCPCLESVPSSDGSNRHLRFNYLFSLLSLSNQKRKATDNYNVKDYLELGETALADVVRTQLIDLRKVLSDVERNGNNSIYYDEVSERFFKAGVYLNKKNAASNRDLYSNLINVVRNIKINIEENKYIPENEFKECFKIDEFYLVYCKSVIDYVNYYENMSKESSSDGKGIVPQCFSILSEYINLIDQIGLDNNYNPMIKVYDYKEKRIKFYTIRDLKREYERVIRNHKDSLSHIEITVEQAEKMEIVHNIDNMSKLVKMTNEKDADIITTGWDILVPGEVNSVVKYSNKKDTATGAKNSAKVVETQDILFRKMVFEKTNYAAKIVGKDKFSGYIGYIYENGIVVFEKFYDDYECTKVAQSNATYIMNISNFAKFTKMNKQEIIQFIKNTNSEEIDRIYHSKNWDNKLTRIIAGIEYSPEAKMIIDSLLEAQKKNKGKSI